MFDSSNPGHAIALWISYLQAESKIEILEKANQKLRDEVVSLKRKRGIANEMQQGKRKRRDTGTHKHIVLKVDAYLSSN